MRISVIIPVYNRERTIQAALDSVLRQTVPADEILVMDDGSTDGTFARLMSYSPTVTVFRQENKGVSAARNALCVRASGDLIAFLDSDDLWHPRYLEHQSKLFKNYPQAVAFIAGHVDFYGYSSYEWKCSESDLEPEVEVLNPLRFFERMDSSAGYFVSPGLLCVPRRVLAEIGMEPFSEKLTAAEDAYLFRRLALRGQAVFAPAPLLAYRITREAASTDKLRMFRLLMECYELLDEHYRCELDGALYNSFRMSFASQKRQFAKMLMRANMKEEARRQICSSLSKTSHPLSFAKSSALLLLSYLPRDWQPASPPPERTCEIGTGKSS